jgi:uncharacterized protein YjiS (DUF1127 family)
MSLLSTIAEKVLTWRRNLKSVRELSRFSDEEETGYRYWTV